MKHPIFLHKFHDSNFLAFIVCGSIHEVKINDCFYFDVTRNEGSLDTLHYLAEK